MEGLVAIAFLILGIITMSIAVLYWEKSDRFGMVVSSVTAVVCLIQFVSRIQT